MVVLDTDHLSLLDRESGGAARRLAAHLSAIASEGVATTIINFEEQMRGWLAYLARARTVTDQIEAYGQLARHLRRYARVTVLDFDAWAAVEFQRLRRTHRRLGTMDLKIAAIVVTRQATLLTRNVSDFRQTREPYAGSIDPRSAGNGSIMRLAPVPLSFARRPRDAIARAADSSRTTHAATECVDACRYLAALIVGAACGESKDQLLADHFEPEPGIWSTAPLAPKIAAIASGSFKHRNPPDVRGTGYVVESLDAALWAFHRSTSFRDGALLAVNLGDDADTTGAVYGQLAGAFYGAAGIPAPWRTKLALRERILTLAALHRHVTSGRQRDGR
jgi:ADP-ribosylglycohydrolase